jgi:hypothetical protein
VDHGDLARTFDWTGEFQRDGHKSRSGTRTDLENHQKIMAFYRLLMIIMNCYEFIWMHMIHMIFCRGIIPRI